MSKNFQIFTYLSFLFFQNQVNSEPSIVIVGAGPAGIAAASKLLQNSFTNITILEAEDRIGGRINSVEFGEGFVDVGAEYCHGQKNNVVYELVQHLDLLEPISEVFEPAVYYSNGSRLDPKFVAELQAVILGYDDTKDVAFNTTGLSIGEIFLKKYNATIVKKYADDKEKTKILIEALRLAEKVSLMIDGSFSWFDTSSVKHYKRSEGHQLLVWKGRGYKTILEVLTKEFPHPEEKLPIENKTLLNKEVEKILWKSGSVTLKTTDNGTYVADHVIFTPSVGVLKKEENLFEPALPKNKLDAIEALGIAGVMKIILHFEKEWWNESDSIFTFIWSDEDLEKSHSEFPYGPIKNNTSWVSGISLMTKVPGNKNILIVWFTGPFLPVVEQLSDLTLKDGCFYVLKKFLGEQYYNLSAPDDILKSSWHSNSHFRGTYSYERVGFENDGVHYQSNLAEPLVDENGKKVVLFAGEASNSVHYSTVHGAIETGFREAERLIDMYKKS